MPVVRLYPRGVSMSSPAQGVTPSPGGRRGAVTGWSAQAARRHVAWLQSVDAESLEGLGIAFTLTVRDLPENAAEWQRMRTSWEKRMRRAGAVRGHWVVEWQRRGVPHLHGAVYWPAGTDPDDVRFRMIRSWLEVAERCRPGARGQFLAVIEDGTGWAKYCAKHAARGTAHYQRIGLPEGWDRSGRVWGYWGTWQTSETVLVLSQGGWWALRRMVRSWRIADARKTRDRESRARRVSAARGMLKHPPGRSAFWGVREWVPEAALRRMLDAVVADGAYLVQVGEADLVDWSTGEVVTPSRTIANSSSGGGAEGASETDERQRR